MTQSGYTSEDLEESTVNHEYSPLFLKLRAELIEKVTELMDSTISSMQGVEKSMGRVNNSAKGVHSTARIWSSFYDPKIVDRLKRESSKKANGQTSHEE
ncbi:unnamed protein product [Pichia kudriavzevii]